MSVRVLYNQDYHDFVTIMKYQIDQKRKGRSKFCLKNEKDHSIGDKLIRKNINILTIWYLIKYMKNQHIKYIVVAFYC